jgi:hypothetical protein
MAHTVSLCWVSGQRGTAVAQSLGVHPWEYDRIPKVKWIRFTSGSLFWQLLAKLVIEYPVSLWGLRPFTEYSS